VRYGVNVPNMGGYADPRELVRLARVAEDAGWDGLFLWDHLAFVWGPPSIDPWTALAGAAASTSRIVLGTAVTPVARRRPHVLANAVATLDLLSGGRVVFGAGLGGVPAEFASFGEADDARTRAERLDEGLDLLRRLWSGERVEHRGRHYVVDGVVLAPLPAQAPLPVWIGGTSAAALRRAARWDGWIADSSDREGMTMSADDLAEAVSTLRSLGARDGFDVAAIGYSDRADPVAYERAGATWWLESIHDRRAPIEECVALVAVGPSR
jgi:probable F420-dependent oxidoreductase